METVRIEQELKHDTFGCVELVSHGPSTEPVRMIRRVVRGRFGAGWVARLLARREERALAHLAQRGASAIARVPALPPEVLGALEALPTARGWIPRKGSVYLRPYAEGLPLHRAEHLPLDFFTLLEDAAKELHAAGVCHNDLHKEQNIVVDPAGRPVLIDFQLATLHPKRPLGFFEGRWFKARCRDDLRHIQKHRRRYTRKGRGPASEGVSDAERMPRTGIPLIWMTTGKPVYKFVTRKLLRTRDGEEMRPSSGPWPSWGDPVGHEAQGALQESSAGARPDATR